MVSGYLCIYIQFKFYFGWPHFTTNAEMSRPKQFHVSRPKRSGFFNNDAHATFFKPSLNMLLGVLLSNLMIQVIRQ